MGSHFEATGSTGSTEGRELGAPRGSLVLDPRTGKGRVLVVEDEVTLRQSIGEILEAEGYQVSVAENGRDALNRLATGALPDVIVLDLRMPVMDGWEFRTIQKNDPRLCSIPVLAISADGSARAAAISAQAYLRKPTGARDLIASIERIVLARQQEMLVRQDETERLAALGRLAAGVGHEINNPLAFVMMNLAQALETLGPALRDLEAHPAAAGSEAEAQALAAHLHEVTSMLQDCQIGGERIRETVGNLQRLARVGAAQRQPLDVHQIIEQSVSIVWNQIRHRARLIKSYGKLPLVCANGTALGQVFLNLLVNAVQSMPEGDANKNEIRISTSVQSGENGGEILVEISDSGQGMPADVMSHAFEPFYTTKPTGEGTGLGLSLSLQTVKDHGGRITVESQLLRGTTFRVFLPNDDALAGHAGDRATLTIAAAESASPRGRILVIDDEVLIGRIVRNALKDEHEVLALDRATEAIGLLERGEAFDLVLCDVVMPDLSGPEFYATVASRWPHVAARLVFMTGGAFTPATAEFMERLPTRVLTKPFKLETLKRLVRERMRAKSSRQPRETDGATATDHLGTGH